MLRTELSEALLIIEAFGVELSIASWPVLVGEQQLVHHNLTAGKSRAWIKHRFSLLW
jgi:hypothetical protein